MRRKKGCSCINLENEVDAWSRKQGLLHHFLDARPAVGPTGAKDVVLDDEGTRFCGE